jgi:sortase (surface protein transpeptidase)
MRSASDKILGIGRPVRLVIAAIGVNAPVEAVEILSNGELATPGQSPWNDVGWYEPGPRPGNPGSAVIDGHLDRPGGYPAVFWRLRDLHVGDSVVVIDAYGKTVRFAVRRVVFYSAETAPFEDIFGSQGGIQLNLITCAGDWIPEQHQTALRLVVYTSLA